MWESIREILSGTNAWMVIVFCAFAVIVFTFASRKGLVSVKTGKVRIGNDTRELVIVRNQIQWAYLFIMSLKGKLRDDESERENYFAEYVLEKCYDKVVEWITLNHISSSNSFIEIKQSEIRCIIYGLSVQSKYKTPEFETRINNWVREVILNLISIRKEYSSNY